MLILAFDREVNFDAFDGAVVGVRDCVDTMVLYRATGGTSSLDATTIQCVLEIVEAAFGVGVVLDASPANGLVAADNGAAWAGAAGLELPFP